MTRSTPGLSCASTRAPAAIARRAQVAPGRRCAAGRSASRRKCRCRQRPICEAAPANDLREGAQRSVGRRRASARRGAWKCAASSAVNARDGGAATWACVQASVLARSNAVAVVMPVDKAKQLGRAWGPRGSKTRRAQFCRARRAPAPEREHRIEHGADGIGKRPGVDDGPRR